MENAHFSSKHKNGTPQINCLGKVIPVLRISIHIYSVSKGIGGTPQIDYLRKTNPVLRVSTHIYGVSQEIEGKIFIFRGNLGI